MFKLIIEYSPAPHDAHDASQRTAQLMEWLTQSEVYGCQSNHNTVVFDTDLMRTMALLYLDGEPFIAGLRLG